MKIFRLISIVIGASILMALFVILHILAVALTVIPLWIAKGFLKIGESFAVVDQISCNGFNLISNVITHELGEKEE